MRHGYFSNQRSSKLAPKGDGPFKILEKINDNASKLELPGEYNVYATFNISDLACFYVYIIVLRSKPSEEGGTDEDIKPEPRQDMEIRVSFIPDGPMTREKTRQIAKDTSVHKQSDGKHTNDERETTIHSGHVMDEGETIFLDKVKIQ